jgi:hypothetical protein
MSAGSPARLTALATWSAPGQGGQGLVRVRAPISGQVMQPGFRGRDWSPGQASCCRLSSQAKIFNRFRMAGAMLQVLASALVAAPFRTRVGESQPEADHARDRAQPKNRRLWLSGGWGRVCRVTRWNEPPAPRTSFESKHNMHYAKYRMAGIHARSGPDLSP